MSSQSARYWVAWLGALLALALATPATAAVTVELREGRFGPELEVQGDGADDAVYVRCTSDGRVEVVGETTPEVRCDRRLTLIVRGGGGDDLLDVGGLTSTPDTTRVAGGAGRDRLVGSSFEDFLWGDAPGRTQAGAESDVVTGGGDHDNIWGGAGSDRLEGEAGPDIIYPGEDGDRVFGGTGADSVAANRDLPARTSDARDLIDGGTGRDFLRGGRGRDRILGRGDDDVLRGDRGSDRILGHSGDDKIGGDAGNDRLFGGSGDDWISGNRGDDAIFGGPGRNLIFS